MTTGPISVRNTGHVSRHFLIPVWLMSLMAAAATTAVGAEPYVPADDNEVLEELPRALLAGRDEVAALRQRLSSDPRNAQLAEAVARRYLEMGKSSGDPRFDGYARAAIAPWWDAADAPPEILRLRAKLKENDHQYDGAADDLKLLLQKQPRDAQAWLELSNIYRVRGDYAEARKAGDALARFAGAVPATLSRAPLLAATGEAERAYRLLTDVLPEARERFPSTVPWIVTQQAEISWALGDAKRAEQHFQEALAVPAPGDYLKRAYCDFLLDQGRNAEVLSLVGDDLSDTGLMLAAAVAARRLGKDALADKWGRELETRFEGIRLRGAQPHLRYEARYVLELKNDPPRALAIALENWRQQKETSDTRNVLEAAAAAAARDPAAPRAVLDFLDEHRTEHVVLRRLAERVRQ